MGQLFSADYQDDVGLPGLHALPSQMERGAARGACVLGVDHRLAQQTGESQRSLGADHFLPGDETGSRITEVNPVNTIGRDAGVFECDPYSLFGKTSDRAVEKFSK
ncbi:hypothetical protein D3C87_1038040 [compost metagenome]